MIAISIYIPSVLIGFLIGYIVLATLWLLSMSKDAFWGNGWDYGYRSGIEEGEKRERERKVGQWILADTYGGRKRYRCSYCLAFALKTDDGQENLSDYCPCCGAYMKGKTNEQRTGN